jgi:predicted nucleotidyltransferase
MRTVSRAALQAQPIRHFLVLDPRKPDNAGMQRIITLAERRASETTRRRAAVDTLVPLLADYARAHAGRFLLFGSAARGEMKHRSDVDLLLVFPAEALSEAWDFAERACWDLGLQPDLLPYAGCKPAFLEHISADARVLA